MTLTNRKSFHSAFGYLGKLLALNLIGFAAGMCWAGTNNQLDHIFSLGFNVNLSVCKFFLILLGGAPPLDNLQLVQWGDNAGSFTDVSGCSILILVLTTLCAASIALGFVCSPHSLDSSYRFPGMQVVLVLVIALGVGFKAFFRVMTADVLLGLLSSLHQVD